MNAPGFDIDVEHSITMAKTRAPRRSSFSIKRERPVKTLVEYLAQKIVIVESPLGYGKTGLLAETHDRLLQDENHWRAAWLSVGKSDDYERLQSHILWAWRHIWPELDAETLLNLCHRDKDSYNIAFGNFLMGPANDSDLDYVLFVDDLHLADPESAALLLNSVAELTPDNYHLVVSGSYRLQDELETKYRENIALFPSELLGFTPREVSEVLLYAAPSPTVQAPGGERLVAALSANLYRLTRGWPLAVKMYADALSRGAIEPSEEIDVSYLGRSLNRVFHENVWASLSEAVQTFLLQVSTVDSLCVDLCNEITGRQDSKRILRDLHFGGCFVEECRGKPGWFEFHPLFLRWLRRKQDKMDEPALSKVSLAASSWFESQGMLPEAAKSMLMTADPVFVEEFVSAMGYKSSRGDTPYFAWIESTPASDFPEKPQLALQAAWGYINYGRVANALQWVDIFEGNAPVDTEKQRRWKRATSDLIRGKCLEMECRYEEAEKANGGILLEYADDMSLTQRYIVTQALAESHMRLGKLDDALKCYLQAEAMAELTHSVFHVALCRTSIANLRMSQGKFTEALDLLEKALSECPDNVAICGLLLSQKGYALTATGHLEEAGDCMEQAQGAFFDLRNIDMQYESRAIRAHYLAAAGQGTLAFREITKTVFEIGGQRIPRGVDLLALLTQGHVALSMGFLPEAREACNRLAKATGKHDVIFRLAQANLRFAVEDEEGSGGTSVDVLPFLEDARREGLGLHEIQLCIRASERLAREGARTDSLLYLNRALKVQAGQHIVEPFLQAGGHLRELLHEIVDLRKSSGEARTLAKSILREFSGNDALELEKNTPESPVSRFGLTEREGEVLELLDAGFTRREIAETLSVSPNTVKSHVSSIYNKLGVTNRLDAFAVIHQSC